MVVALSGRWGVSWLLVVSVVVAAGVGASGASPGVGATPGGDTTRVSVSSTGRQGRGDSEFPSISAGGRYVVFSSFASNMVSGDTNWGWDIFVRDRKLGTTERANVSSTEQQTRDELVASPAGFGINADGRYVVFASSASNLVPHDTRQLWDVFIRDRKLGITRRMSVSSAGHQANNGSVYPAVSASGRYVVFESAASNLVSGDTNLVEDVFVRDRRPDLTRRVSVSSAERQANSASGQPAISADGRYVVFESSASNLVPGDTNDRVDVFVRDRKLGITRRVSVSSAEQQGHRDSYGGGSVISADGRYVVFYSGSRSLVPGDTNGADDVFVRDRTLGTTLRVSVSNAEQQGNSFSFDPAISADGLFVVFASRSTNLVSNDTNQFTDVFVRDNGSTPGRAAGECRAADGCLLMLAPVAGR